MAVIRSISVCAARVPLDRVTSFSNRTVSARDYGLVKVTSEDGVTGIGFCYVGSAGGELLPIAVEKLLAPVLIGRDSLDVEALWREMYQEALLQGRAGVVMRAISILDTALWDLNARSAGLPLHRYLGAASPDRVLAYASGGYYLDGKTPELLGEEMAHYVSLGFKAVKMKTGRLSPKDEEARVAAAREAIGPDIDLMLDVNNGWSDVTEALQYVRRFERYNPAFVEEPFLVDDIDSHARLARATPIPVATGEVEVGRWRHKELLDKGGAAILQTDAVVCGGITEWRRIAAMAAGYGVPMYPHWFHDVHAPLVAATPNARYVEFFWDDQVLNFRRLIDRQLEQEGGYIKLHQTPGLGFDFDEQAVSRYSLNTAGGPWLNVQSTR
ncbi:mandelate racemase/muconate lactonizing enzyme family protein [Stutzerimonas nosocomialis]|uniref:Mandelate racemase/muconate lactonizing enzyme family protein n=1 Tax=Stutzerimonas nosocomialis TaxID=1056496 RepID=A0A5R9QF55_9GAMM|nr:mandelate racemase/muconate lactonizing enzyme family protein [Stutzerimonas nosocomialis]TLX63731.1 mandelate racemase/muconate lactonizing enzyme family protein [Stutzerimonas nosocomialis]